eukprot:TRINITY_DN4801_c0_g2_i10.p1 TRINITY_DN4801_c0_g2~~TRINITY_DN4801_c0_g2_i10.p1  ORF type:complete len:119 (+),score=20.35 TRINITY_DN4801_c0_g2_i10:248-604(+)
MKAYRRTFAQVVIDTDKDVLVLFCSYTCTECFSMTSLFNNVAWMICGNGNLRFVLVDPMKNDIDQFQVQKYPALVLFPGFNKGSPVVYEGPRTEVRIANFIRTHSSHVHTIPDLSIKT